PETLPRKRSIQMSHLFWSEPSDDSPPPQSRAQVPYRRLGVHTTHLVGIGKWGDYEPSCRLAWSELCYSALGIRVVCVAAMPSNTERTRAEGARWRAINLAALRLFLRIAPSERQRVFALTIIIGALCGLAAVAFHLAIQAAEGALIERAMAAPGTSWMVWTILVPTLGGLISGALLSYVVPDARGSGIPQVKVAYGVKGGRLPIRVAIGKFIIGVIQIGSGASLGREGPTVQICAGIASSLGQLAALS